MLPFQLCDAIYLENLYTNGNGLGFSAPRIQLNDGFRSEMSLERLERVSLFTSFFKIHILPHYTT